MVVTIREYLYACMSKGLHGVLFFFFASCSERQLRQSVAIADSKLAQTMKDYFIPRVKSATQVRTTHTHSTYTFTHTHTCILSHTHTHTHTHTHIHTCTHTHLHTHAYTHTQHSHLLHTHTYHGMHKLVHTRTCLLSLLTLCVHSPPTLAPTQGSQPCPASRPFGTPQAAGRSCEIQGLHCCHHHLHHHPNRSQTVPLNPLLLRSRCHGRWRGDVGGPVKHLSLYPGPPPVQSPLYVPVPRCSPMSRQGSHLCARVGQRW